MTTNGQPLPTARLARGDDLTPDPALYPFASRWQRSEPDRDAQAPQSLRGGTADVMRRRTVPGRTHGRVLVSSVRY